MAATLTTTRSLWIRSEDLRNRLESWEASTILDARPQASWNTDYSGVPDAVRLNPDRPSIDPHWPKDQLTVVYGVGREDEGTIARLVGYMREQGFAEAYGLRGGLPAWQAAEKVLEMD